MFEQEPFFITPDERKAITTVIDAYAYEAADGDDISEEMKKTVAVLRRLLLESVSN